MVSGQNIKADTPFVVFALFSIYRREGRLEQWIFLIRARRGIFLRTRF